MEDSDINRAKTNVIRRAQTPALGGGPKGPRRLSPTRPAPAPEARSAISLIPKMLMFSLRDRTDATAKRRFSVQVPTRMVRYVVLVFFVLPLLLFVYREAHMGDSNSLASVEHKSRLRKVDASAVFSHLAENVNSTSYGKGDQVHQTSNEANEGADSLNEEKGGGEEGQQKHPLDQLDQQQEQDHESNEEDNKDEVPPPLVVSDPEKIELGKSQASQNRTIAVDKKPDDTPVILSHGKPEVDETGKVAEETIGKAEQDDPDQVIHGASHIIKNIEQEEEQPGEVVPLDPANQVVTSTDE